jgi:hypothetical protein
VLANDTVTLALQFDDTIYTAEFFAARLEAGHSERQRPRASRSEERKIDCQTKERKESERRCPLGSARDHPSAARDSLIILGLTNVGGPGAVELE